MKSPLGTQGFTLIELVVVLFLIGIVMTFSTMSVNTSGKPQGFDDTVDRLIKLTQLAQESAVTKGRSHGIIFDQQGYAFFRLEEKGWEAIEGDFLFTAYEFPKNIRAEFSTFSGSTDNDFGEEKITTPDIILDPYGTMTLFELLIEDKSKAKSCTLKGGYLGEVTKECSE